MGKTYKVINSGKYVTESEVTMEKGQYKTKSGELVSMHWEKMSKSKHNGVDPLNLLNKYGIDTTRLLILADVAPTSTRNWSEDSKCLKSQLMVILLEDNIFINLFI